MSDDGAAPQDNAGPNVPAGAVSRELPIINKRGLHARASAKFVQMVERFNAEVWAVECRLTGATYTVAASDPVCPRCGATLCATVEFTHDPRGSAILEEGPMLDFVRSLR